MKNDRGFSLVELIIVIAIMAVLVGVVGTQVIPYMESSKQAKDIQILSSYATAGVMAYASHPDVAPVSGTMTITIESDGTDDTFTCDDTNAQKIADELNNLIGRDAVTEAASLFQSKMFRPTVKIEVVYDFSDRTIKVLAIDGSNVTINANDNIYGRL
jgi:prepilin-type N-terminal cleavage/methylation domain-containing protein